MEHGQVMVDLLMIHEEICHSCVKFRVNFYMVSFWRNPKAVEKWLAGMIHGFSSLGPNTCGMCIEPTKKRGVRPNIGDSTTKTFRGFAKIGKQPMWKNSFGKFKIPDVSFLCASLESIHIKHLSNDECFNSPHIFPYQ